MPNLSTTIPQGNITSPRGAHIRYGTDYDETNNILSGLDTSDYDIVFISEDDTPIDASSVTFTSNTGLTSTNVAGALNELNANITELDNNVSDKVELLSEQAILKTGGTMTGPLIAAANPVENMEVATKQYVDNSGGAFFAIYNETTYEEIKDAYDKGKIVLAKERNNNAIYYLSYIASNAIFIRILPSSVTTSQYMQCNSITSAWEKKTSDICNNNVYKTKETPIEHDEKSYLRPIIASQNAPTAADGNIGDIWFQY